MIPELRPITWRAWLLLTLLVVAYLVLGVFFDSDAVLELWIYRIGLTGCSFVPLIFVAVYSLTRSKWWQNDMGTAIVWVKLALIPMAAPLAWVFWFQNGMLTNTYLAWLAVVGPIVSMLAVLYLTLVFNRTARSNRAAKLTEKEDANES